MYRMVKMIVVLQCIILLGFAYVIVHGQRCPDIAKIQRTCEPGRVQTNNLVNVALNKKLTSLGTLENGDKLLNGNINNSYPCTHTTTDDYFLKYMLVDFGEAFNISSVYLHGYKNESLHGVEVYLGLIPERMVLVFASEGTIPDDCTVVLKHHLGARYVKVAKRGSEDLILCGLEVFSVGGYKPGRK